MADVLTAPVVTSTEAHELAMKITEDYTQRKNEEKKMNQRKEEKAAAAKKEGSGGVSRMVTEVDYEKHERTVAELQRQEAEEEFNRKREEASRWCTLDHEHGPECRQMVGGCSHDHQKEWQIYEKSTEEKLAAADRFRQEGNESYRKHNYGLAAVHYRKALLQFDYTFAEGDKEEKQVDDLKMMCLLNLAACKCQQEEWDDVLTQCRLALEINPRSVKAYYRTGVAHMSRDKFELAKDAFMSAYEIEPKNPEVISALRQLKKNMSSYKVRRKEMAHEMMSGKDVPNEPCVEETDVAAPSGDVVSAEGEANDACKAEAASTERSLVPEVNDVAAKLAAEEAVAEASVDEALAASVEEIAAQEVSRASVEADSGMRRRRGAGAGDEHGKPLHHRNDVAAADAGEEDDDADDDKSLKALQGKAMTGLLIVAGVLGVSAVVAATIAALYDS